ncbi:O-methyltransferase [Paenibacillaceae bacterium WGS1546]|uniref:O-methyltransferase n=1 Tax=Cohnella sp. WGS1546 TaxID=3366810 RepID=UPI00372D2CE2
MSTEHFSLTRQVDVALEKLAGELIGMTAGTIVLQIRDDSVGRFGIRHLPMDCDNREHSSRGMNESQVLALRKLAVEALRRKKGWTHGEISYDFVLKQDKVYVSVQFESNYNMANVLFRYSPKNRGRRGASSE